MFAPISKIYIQKYSQSIIMITVVRFPYMPNPSKKSTYREKPHEKTLHATAANSAPGI